ncbi:uncharacterized protein LOC131149308 [Malania oleifera]|uniref:uncharacterized protein LOC131149308 n=1 Tax=Malania oleifera TaxID=397392 RepID=UPI0025ADC1BA|nr:uncharacterized protein LOC131149308 [Malania oleifera]
MDSYYSSSSSYSGHYHGDKNPAVPLHLWFFLCTLFFFLGFSWYAAYESMLDSCFDQLKLLLMLSPLLLLLGVHLLSAGDPRRRRQIPFMIPVQERDSLHGGGGGSPWGIGLLLVVLLFMVSYQSYFHERWFPLLSR